VSDQRIHWAWLVPGWVTVCRQVVNRLGM